MPVSALPLVIVTAPCHPWLIDKLAERFTVSHRPDLSYEELSAMLPAAEGLVVTTRLRIDAGMLQRADNLRWIGRLGSGLELIDTAACEKRGILVYSSPEGNRNAVAEHALGMLLCQLNYIHSSMNEVATGQWLRSTNRGTELFGKTVGIIGFGNTGSRFARLLQAFDVTILAYDKDKQGYASGAVREAQPEQIQRYADVISFHVPLNDASLYMCNRQFLEACRQKPVIVNTSRGKVVKLSDLATALEKGQISGACLDVLENEKLETYTPEEKKVLDALVRRRDVVITPHIAGYSHQSYLQMAEILFRKIVGNEASL